MDNYNNSKRPNVGNSKKKSATNLKLIAELKKKKECEKKALKIIDELIDGGLTEDVLFDKLCSINACHYEDVVEERFIIKQCGYVMCNQQLINIPSQKYKIVNNNVYDITERKRFCSNMCYKSSKYLQCQLLTSPLWLHDLEVVPKFKLLKKSLHESSENCTNLDKISLNGSSVNNAEKNCNTICSNEKLHEKISKLNI